MRRRDPRIEDLNTTRCALAMCENIDWNVGRVLGMLAELELERTTIVVYLSDNGPDSWRWNGGMRGRKCSTDEGGVRALQIPGAHVMDVRSVVLTLRDSGAPKER